VNLPAEFRCVYIRILFKCTTVTTDLSYRAVLGVRRAVKSAASDDGNILAACISNRNKCSPCFQDFNKFRGEATGQRRRVQMWLAAAAVLVFVVGGWLWVRSRPSGRTAAVVVLDLRGRAMVRGGSTPETSQPSLEVPRNARSLNLELPIGSNEGAYDVALLNPSGAELFRTSATAKLEDHIVVLRAGVDLAGVSPGSYFLGLRQPGLEWMRFPIRVL